MPSLTFKPCPFCGSDDISWCVKPDGEELHFEIGCNSCTAGFGKNVAAREAISITETKEAFDELLAAWNRRAGEGETPTWKGVGR